MKRRLVLSFGMAMGLLVSACATKPQTTAQSEMPGQVEGIYAAAFTRDTILMRVTSNGCTDKDDIKPFITKLRTRTVMTLRRLEEDTCVTSRRESVLLQWSFDELGIEPGTEVEISNPYVQPRQAS